MKYLFLILLSAFLLATGCHKKESLTQKVTVAVSPYLKSGLQNGEKTDSVLVKRIDTITEKSGFSIRYTFILDEVEERNILLKHLAEVAKITKEQLNTEPQNPEKQERYNSANEKLTTEKKNINALMSSSKTLQQKIYKADSTRLVLYGAEGIHYYTDSRNSVQKKDFYLLLTPDFKVVEKDYFLK